MPLSRADKRKALAWFKAKNGGRGCPVCGASSWKIEDDAGLPHAGRRVKIHIIPVICLACGHLLLFNVSIIFQPPPDEAVDEVTDE